MQLFEVTYTATVHVNSDLYYFLRPFSLDSFHDYQKHFTVMNYRDEADLKHIESVDFIPLWNQQYPMHQWEGVEKEIFKAIRELFQASTAKPPPAGIREFLQVLHEHDHTLSLLPTVIGWVGLVARFICSCKLSKTMYKA